MISTLPSPILIVYSGRLDSFTPTIHGAKQPSAKTVARDIRTPLQIPTKTFAAAPHLVVVARVVVAAVRLPVLPHNVLHRHQLLAALVAVRQDGQPCQHGPDAVLLANVVRPCK